MAFYNPCIYIYVYILDLLKVVGNMKHIIPNVGLMVIYHGTKLKNHLKQTKVYLGSNLYQIHW